MENTKNNDARVTANPIPLLDLEDFLHHSKPAKLNEDQVSVTARLLVDCRCHLGESILWDDHTETVLFTSILDRTFHKLPFQKGSQLETYHLPRMLCSFAMLERSDKGKPPGYLVAWEDGFQLYNLEENQPLSEMSQGPAVAPLGLPDRLNDGRCDPTGQYYICGGCAGKSPSLQVFQCEFDATTQQLKHLPIVDTIQTTNGICWSPDGKTMYLADSPTHKIQQLDYDVNTGTVSNPRPFHQKPTGFPDGSCVDAQGYVWNATWREGEGTGMVDRIDPRTGEVVFTVYLPDNTSEASCCCLGGPNLDILFITSAWEHLDPSSEPYAGGLYAVKLPEGMTGLKERRFRIR